MKFDRVQLRNKQAVLDTYLLDSSEEFANIDLRPGVLIFPGGGYYSTSDREAEPVAMAFLAEGYNAFVLRYTTGEDENFDKALEDAEEAIGLIRENAWGTDGSKITVVGFSAGGHLAAALGTIGKNKPNALILGYPCILDSLNLAFPVPSLEQKVDAATPPTFLFSTFEDAVVPIEHTISFMQALNEHGIPFESHIFQHGVHGLSMAKPFTSSGVKTNVNEDFAQWFPLSVSWLHRVLGDFQADRESLIPDAEEAGEYSIDVTLGSLWRSEDCRNILKEFVPALANEELLAGIKPYSLRMVNSHLPGSLSEQQLLELDGRLKDVSHNK
ncbi:alpha/beta hydrolase [Terribacillus saccharophilus]|uniref:alpha/beta hydrolase n=1 Tax=Terribacillus saccharophilus TaxID=361277 RepID=UPI003982C157